MIVEFTDTKLVLHSQVSHARACGTFAELWDTDRFGIVPHFVREAAATHDDGWTEWDARPRLALGKDAPHGYSSMPGDDYREIWRRGTDRGWASGVEVGLLVSLHGMRFFGHRVGPEDRAFLTAERARQRRALAALGIEPSDPDHLPPRWERWSEWIFFWDGLSLFLCGEFQPPWRNEVRRRTDELEIVATRRVSGGECEVTLDPFPFRRDFEVEVAHWSIPRCRYPDQPALDAAIAAARQGWRRCRIQSA